MGAIVVLLLAVVIGFSLGTYLTMRRNIDPLRQRLDALEALGRIDKHKGGSKNG